MSRFTKALRQEIVETFAKEHGGVFDAAAFLSEVNQVGAAHPAYDWFQWDDRKAAREHRLDQARAFAQGLRIRFEVETVERGSVKVVSQSMPLVISPVHSRAKGGGYRLSDPDDPEHLAELCRQAAQQLRWFVERFQMAIAHAGVDSAALGQVLLDLDAASSVSQPEAAE